MQTSHCLRGHCDSVTVVERDVSTAKRMKEHLLLLHGKKVHVEGGVTLADWLLTTRRRQNIINVAYFDYMGSITGNRSRGEHPLEDISCFLGRWACGDGGHVVMCMTFCARVYEKLPDDCPSVQSAILGLYLEPIIRWHGYGIEYKKCEVYRRTQKSMPMVFVALVLCKQDKYIRNECALLKERQNIDFAVSKCGKFYDGYRQKVL